ncbi:MAG: type II secretion system protein [Bacilli bacterium]|nr:type II secretion system protein [Bacilli bacterium]
MKNKKGFTLIELLAVIVILGIIMVIAIPFVTGYIERSKKDATKTSTQGILDAASLYYSSNDEEGVLTSAIIDKSDNLISYKGKVDNFYLSFNEEGDIAIVTLNDKYCGYKYFMDKKVTVGEVKTGVCYIGENAINTSDFLPTESNSSMYVHNETSIPSGSGLQNEIQVVNGIEVTGYTVSESEPTTPSNGDIWVIANNDSSTQLVLGKVYVKVSNLKQYNAGKWTSVDSYLYDGSSWVRLSSIKYADRILNGADPVLGSGMIPVTIMDDGTVKYADVNSEWYNYTNKNWANAVILSSGTYNVGDIIPEANIQSYFVWIPRYKYKLWNVDTNNPIKTEHSIEIIFQDKNHVTSDSVSGECTTPMTTGASGNCDNGEYMTHPAFITFNSNGMWIGKFETGYLGAAASAAAQVLGTDSTKVISKPNSYSWRSNTLYNQFLVSFNYNRTLDSHMIKNTEWGAMAYLSHSKYGIDRKVNFNNSSGFKTGVSSLLTLNQQTYPSIYGDGPTYNEPYNTSTGYLASSTGNIYGIYDTNGGTYEGVSAYVSGQYGSSGFTAANIVIYDNKYFDIYNSASTATSYNYRILGDAIGEMGPFLTYKDSDAVNRYHCSWYSDSAYFINAANPWLLRGGYYMYGILSGQFDFFYHVGAASSFGSRLVLTPQ